MSSFYVVLDACVLYPFHLRDALLRTAEKGLYRVHWSATILDEAVRNLVRSYGLRNAKKPVVTGFFAQNGWLVAVYEAGTVLAYSKARAWVGVGSAMR